MVFSFNADSTLGALEIGCMLSIFLFGIVTLQVIVYFESFPEDPWTFKSLVLAVWLFDLGHTICVTHLIYTTTISSYGHPEKLVYFPSLYAMVLFGAFISVSVQGFFSIRIHKILGRPYIAFFAYILGCTRFLGSLAVAILAFKEPSLTRVRDALGWLITTLLVVGAALDVLITASMCYYVAKQRQAELSDRAAQLLNRLITWTVQTGLITGVSAVSLVICFHLMPNTLVWVAIYAFLAKLYTNSLLVSLNARRKLRKLAPRGNSSSSSSRFKRTFGEGNQLPSVKLDRLVQASMKTPHFEIKKYPDWERLDVEPGVRGPLEFLDESPTKISPIFNISRTRS